MASSDQYFAVIPESVLYADISHAAVRVYGVLRRHADKNDGTCHPGRKRIAEFAHMSPSHVDRAIQELVGIGDCFAREGSYLSILCILFNE